MSLVCLLFPAALNPCHVVRLHVFFFVFCVGFLCRLRRRGGASGKNGHDNYYYCTCAWYEHHSSCKSWFLRYGCLVAVACFDWQDGTNALMAAASNGHLEAAKSLVKAGAALDKQNSDGHNALMFAYNGRAQASVSCVDFC